LKSFAKANLLCVFGFKLHYCINTSVAA